MTYIALILERKLQLYSNADIESDSTVNAITGEDVVQLL